MYATQTLSAVQVLRFNGEKAELELLKVIHSFPGLSVYSLSQKASWTCGKTQQAVERLHKKGLVEFGETVESSRVQKKVFETPATKLISFRKKELELMEKFLKRKAE